MLSLMEPSEQLLTAMLVAAATVSAAVVNARAQVKVAREERRSPKPGGTASKRARTLLLLGAAVALGLGWNAVARREAHASTGSGGFMAAGVTSLLGSDYADDDGPIVVAALELRRPVSEEQAVALLHAHGLQAYAVDVRIAGEPATWLPLSVGREPALSLPRARADAVRRARGDACALEHATPPTPHSDPDAPRDSLGVGLDATATAGAGLPPTAAMIGDAAIARRRADRLSTEPAVIHALRVLATPEAAARAARDDVVEAAEIARFDPGWPLEAPAPPPAPCAVVEAAAH